MNSITALAAVLVLVTAIDVLSSRIITYHPAITKPSGNRTYTYLGDDYPERWELPATPPVTLVVEDPIHYPITGPDALQEWASNSPEGVSYIRLGPHNRAFSFSMLHQLHCLRLMRLGLAGDYSTKVQHHFAHCLQYLRQMVLCTPDLTLEPVDVLERAGGAKEPGSVHVCHDWGQVYDAMNANFEAWARERQGLGLGLQ